MYDHDFFESSSEQSLVKRQIIVNYFDAWFKIIGKQKTDIAYIDLFAGPGKYKDGTKSTPFLIIEKALQREDLCKKLIMVFNDKKREYAENLKSEINSLSMINKLKFYPKVYSCEVGKEVLNILEDVGNIPKFTFLDPWGYKGLSLSLFKSAIEHWGSEFVFFFNYNRIRPGISNECVEHIMNDIFGKNRADALRKEISVLNPDESEKLILANLEDALKSIGAKFVLTFLFKDDEKDRTSHYLAFATKHNKGYNIMMDIMAKASSSNNQGVASFEFDPKIKTKKIEQLELFQEEGPLDRLCELLLNEFSGKILKVMDICKKHRIPYTRKNYKDALKKLVLEKRIIVEPSIKERRKDTLGDELIIAFPVKDVL